MYQVSYSPNIGELPGGSPSFLRNNTVHMFPLQMSPATVLALLDFFGWKKAIVLTEPHTQIEVKLISNNHLLIMFVLHNWLSNQRDVNHSLFLAMVLPIILSSVI
jgi:hypothetical protein